MTKAEFDFETWFDCLSAMVLDQCGVQLNDEASFRAEYAAGVNCSDLASLISAEYQD